MEEKQKATRKEISQFLRNLKIHGDSNLKDETLFRLIEALVFDKKVQVIDKGDEKDSLPN